MAWPRIVAGLLLCLLIALPGCYRAIREGGERNEVAAAVKTRLLELFGHCRAGRLSAASDYIVYMGRDAERKWKDLANYEQEEERQGVLEVCERINGYLNRSDGYEFGRFLVQRESEGVWHVWEVLFKRGTSKEQRYFAFLMVKQRFALGDID